VNLYDVNYWASLCYYAKRNVILFPWLVAVYLRNPVILKTLFYHERVYYLTGGGGGGGGGGRVQQRSNPPYPLSSNTDIDNPFFPITTLGLAGQFVNPGYLQWILDHFGPNPNAVSVFGRSSLHELLSSYLSPDLIRKITITKSISTQSIVDLMEMKNKILDILVKNGAKFVQIGPQNGQNLAQNGQNFGLKNGPFPAKLVDSGIKLQPNTTHWWMGPIRGEGNGDEWSTVMKNGPNGQNSYQNGQNGPNFGQNCPNKTDIVQIGNSLQKITFQSTSIKLFSSQYHFGLFSWWKSLESITIGHYPFYFTPVMTSHHYNQQQSIQKSCNEQNTNYKSGQSGQNLSKNGQNGQNFPQNGPFFPPQTPQGQHQILFPWPLIPFIKPIDVINTLPVMGQLSYWGITGDMGQFYRTLWSRSPIFHNFEDFVLSDLHQDRVTTLRILYERITTVQNQKKNLWDRWTEQERERKEGKSEQKSTKNGNSDQKSSKSTSSDQKSSKSKHNSLPFSSFPHNSLNVLDQNLYQLECEVLELQRRHVLLCHSSVYYTNRYKAMLDFFLVPILHTSMDTYNTYIDTTEREHGWGRDGDMGSYGSFKDGQNMNQNDKNDQNEKNEHKLHISPNLQGQLRSHPNHHLFNIPHNTDPLNLRRFQVKTLMGTVNNTPKNDKNDTKNDKNDKNLTENDKNLTENDHKDKNISKKLKNPQKSPPNNPTIAPNRKLDQDYHHTRHPIYTLSFSSVALMYQMCLRGDLASLVIFLHFLYSSPYPIHPYAHLISDYPPIQPFRGLFLGLARPRADPVWKIVDGIGCDDDGQNGQNWTQNGQNLHKNGQNCGQNGQIFCQTCPTPHPICNSNYSLNQWLWRHKKLGKPTVEMAQNCQNLSNLDKNGSKMGKNDQKNIQSNAHTTHTTTKSPTTNSNLAQSSVSTLGDDLVVKRHWEDLGRVSWVEWESLCLDDAHDILTMPSIFETTYRLAIHKAQVEDLEMFEGGGGAGGRGSVKTTKTTATKTTTNETSTSTTPTHPTLSPQQSHHQRLHSIWSHTIEEIASTNPANIPALEHIIDDWDSNSINFEHNDDFFTKNDQIYQKSDQNGQNGSDIDQLPPPIDDSTSPLLPLNSNTSLTSKDYLKALNEATYRLEWYKNEIRKIDTEMSSIDGSNHPYTSSTHTQHIAGGAGNRIAEGDGWGEEREGGKGQNANVDMKLANLTQSLANSLEDSRTNDVYTYNTTAKQSTIDTIRDYKRKQKEIEERKARESAQKGQNGQNLGQNGQNLGQNAQARQARRESSSSSSDDGGFSLRRLFGKGKKGSKSDKKDKNGSKSDKNGPKSTPNDQNGSTNHGKRITFRLA
jgi:hypothetical protein